MTELEAAMLWNHCPLCKHRIEPGSEIDPILIVKINGKEILFHGQCLESECGEGFTPLDLLKSLEIEVINL